MMIKDDEKDNHHHNRIIRVDEGHSLNPTSPTIASGHVDNHGAFGVFALIMIGMVIIFLIIFIITMSYAALRAADQDWIIKLGYTSGGYILGRSQRPNSRLRHSARIGPDLLCLSLSVFRHGKNWMMTKRDPQTDRCHISMIYKAEKN